ncbi:MAG: hypothetical protein DMF69_14190 [Acidobacteria bacterium]|nr:MAG: hypothetical protein DMF69_14190 [Acidobacteriota bacterium]
MEKDETLAFCRADGTALVNDSSSSGSEMGTARLASGSMAAEVETSLLPNITNAGINRSTGPTSLLTTPVSPATRLISKPNRRRPVLIVTVVIAAIAATVSAFAVRSYLSTSPRKSIESIAVLPFENKSGNADSDYLSDGVAESLIYKLSQLPNLRVSPRSSVFRYRGKDLDVEQVGAELGVDAVMSGRLTQRGDDLTISVDLVDVRNKKTLWGEHYERKISDLLVTQREIATTITEKLQLKLSGESAEKLAKKYTDNSEAYELFLRGQFHYGKRTKDELLQSIEFYQQAIKLDPNFALAYVGMARSYNVMPSFAFMSPKEAMPKAKAASERALQIDPNLAEAHAALANVLSLFEWDWAGTDREFKRAMELDPNVAEIHNRYGRSYLMPLGRMEEATAELKRALELEPISAPIGSNLVVIYLRSRKNNLALQQAKTMSAIEPNHPAIRSWLSYAYNANGMYAETIALNEKVLQSDPRDQDALSAIGFAYAKSGRRRDAEAVISKVNDIARSQYVSHYNMASIYGALGEKDKSLAELEKAFDERDRLCVESKYDFLMDPIREDPRFVALLKRLNLPE